jgi:hypothetical protein
MYKVSVFCIVQLSACAAALRARGNSNPLSCPFAAVGSGRHAFCGAGALPLTEWGKQVGEARERAESCHRRCARLLKTGTPYTTIAPMMYAHSLRCGHDTPNPLRPFTPLRMRLHGSRTARGLSPASINAGVSGPPPVTVKTFGERGPL